MVEHISFFLKSNDRGDVNASILWGSLKAVMRGHIISYTSAKRKAQEVSLKDIEANFHCLEQIYQSSRTGIVK